MVLRAGFASAILVGLIVGPPAGATAITLGAGVTNPPPSLQSTGLVPPQLAIADTATLVPEANFAGIIQSVLNAQGFTAANNWSLGAVLMVDNNATFNITQYNLFLNAGGTAFGEDMDFTLNPNLAAPANVPAGSTVTEHWLQILNEDQAYGGFGYGIVPLQGFWQTDNGDKAGGKAAGAGTGPYYDSNAGGKNFSTPPTFHDAPQFYSGVGTYLHFDVFPTWDIFTPAAGNNPATDTIDVGSQGLAWGFQIVAVPEPSSVLLMTSGGLMIALGAWRRRKR